MNLLDKFFIAMCALSIVAFVGLWYLKVPTPWYGALWPLIALLVSDAVKPRS